MSGIRNQEWYDLNQARAYPVDDAATCIDDNRKRLPNHIIADLNLVFPEAAGRYAYLGAVTATPNLVSVVLFAAESPESAAQAVPLAAITVASPILQDRHYPLEPLYDGVGGWIVFGDGVTELEHYSGRFSTPIQSLLTPRAARWYKPLPIRKLGKLHNVNPMTGLIKMLAGTDLEVSRECLEIPSHPPGTAEAQLCGDIDQVARQALVFSLTDTGASPNRNVYDIYSGPCGARPESHNCGDPEPIEFLGTVAPDCCGNITLELRGCVVVSKVIGEVIYDAENNPITIVDACGAVIRCDIGLDEACVTPDRLPDSDGRLPNEYDDLCVSQSSISLPPDPPEPPEPPPFSFSSSMASQGFDPDLPYLNCFEPGEPHLIARQGGFTYVDVGLPDGRVLSTEVSGTATQNVAVWDEPLDTKYRRVTLTADLPGAGASAHKNIQVVINYRPREIGSSVYQFWTAELDWDGHWDGYRAVRIGFFNGTSWSTLLSFPVPFTAMEHRFEIMVETYANEDVAPAAWIVARFKDLTTDEEITLGPLYISLYGAVEGKFGLGAYFSATRFICFEVDNLV